MTFWRYTNQTIIIIIIIIIADIEKLALPSYFQPTIDILVTVPETSIDNKDAFLKQ